MRGLWWLCLLALSTAAGRAEVLNPNGDFEGPFAANGIAEGWANDTYTNWGDYEVTFARETENPRSGAACQRITCHRMGYFGPKRKGWIGLGATQLRAAPLVPLKKGRVYSARMWLRGEGIAVTVQIRQAGRPWWPYAEQTVVARDEWREVDFRLTSGGDDPGAFFMLKFAELGTIWVDDAVIEEIGVPEEVREGTEPVPGNLLHNGDFSLDRANWLGDVGWYNLGDPVYRIEPGDRGPCLRAEVPEGLGSAVTSDVVDLTPGYPIRIACRVKASAPTNLRFGLYHMGAQHSEWPFCGTQAEVGTQWQTLEANGSAPFIPGRVFGYVRIAYTGPITIWVDDVEVRQDGGTAPDGRPRAAVISDRHPRGLYHDGEPARLRLLSWQAEGGPPATVDWGVADIDGEAVLSGTWQPGSGAKESEIEVGRLPRGWYRARVSWLHEGRTYLNECTFCLLPPGERTGPAEDSPFGAHFMVGPIHLGLAHAVGARWMRLWPPGYTLWERVEPKQGEWRWDDEPIRKIVREDGLRLVGMLESPPDWSKGYIGEKDWADWEHYVATMVEHYKDDIHVWEVLNEPDLKWWYSKPAGPSRAQFYFDALRHSYPVIKRVDPAATVYGGCVAGDFREDGDNLQFLQELIDLGALQLMDVLSFHYYHSYSLPLPVDEGDDPIADSMARVREMMRKAGKEVPIVNSEGGVYDPAPSITYRPTTRDNIEAIEGERGAMLMARQYIAGWAAGVSRYFYYNFFLSGCPAAKCWDSFVDGDGQPRPYVAAYAVMSWLLDGARYERTERPTADVWVHRFATPRGPLIAAWSRTGTTAEIGVPDAVSAWDMVGRAIPLRQGEPIQLTERPVYVLRRG